MGTEIINILESRTLTTEQKVISLEILSHVRTLRKFQTTFGKDNKHIQDVLDKLEETVAFYEKSLQLSKERKEEPQFNRVSPSCLRNLEMTPCVVDPALIADLHANKITRDAAEKRMDELLNSIMKNGGQPC